MQCVGGRGSASDPAGELTALPIKLTFSKTAHLEMLRLQSGLLRHSSIPRTPENKLERTLHGTVKWVLAFRLSNNKLNGDGGCSTGCSLAGFWLRLIGLVQRLVATGAVSAVTMWTKYNDSTINVVQVLLLLVLVVVVFIIIINELCHTGIRLLAWFSH